MVSGALDFAVFGSTPLARLVAGLLADAHGRRVALVAESNAAYRIARGLDLSLAPITRPESWALLRRGTTETMRLLGRIARKDAWRRVDPLFFAQDPAGKQALAHVMHMGFGFDILAERAAERVAGPGREGVILRDAVLLDRARLESALDAWLDTVGVERRQPDDPAIGPSEEGGAAIGERVAETAILADDAAIARLLPARAHGADLLAAMATSVLTEPARALDSPVMIGIDTGLALCQRPSRAIAATAPGAPSEAVPLVGRVLAGQGHVRRAGEVGFPVFRAADGAMLCGRPAPDRPVVLAGLGLGGAFLAPALARWLAGVPEGSEKAYFDARGFGRDMAASPVAEFAPHWPAEAAA